MLDADYAITAAAAMLASAGVGATVGVIGLAAFNAKVRDWLEETTLRGEWGYRQRELFRMYLALAGAAAILIPLLIIVAAPPAEIFWLEVLGRSPLSAGWSFLIVVFLTGVNVAAVAWFVFRALQTGASLAQEIRDQQTPRDLKGGQITSAGSVISPLESDGALSGQTDDMSEEGRVRPAANPPQESGAFPTEEAEGGGAV